MKALDKVEKLFSRAMLEPPETREHYLQTACGEDLELLDEVRELISFVVSGSEFMVASAIEDEAKRLASESAEVRPGDRLGSHHLLSCVGSGGMGSVFRARDTRNNRIEAIKTLMPEFGTDPARIRRFQREAKAIAALNHAGIVEIYEVGEEQGIHFMAMEWVDGKTLADHLQEGGPMAPIRTAKIGEQVSRALSAAHGQGLIHRDIKPSNLMVTPGGQVKVLDFGLVKARQDVSGAVSAESLTLHGSIIGTIDYMSPEQILGKDLDPRTDLFSLGVVMYEMATGRLPYRGSTIAEAIDRVLDAEPEPMTSVNGEAVDSLESVVRCCLAKEPADRFQSADDLAEALRQVI